MCAICYNRGVDGRPGKPRRQAAVVVLVALMAAATLTGCSRASRQATADQAPDVALVINLQPNPPTVGWGQVTVEVADATGKAMEGAIVDLRGDMSHAGMRPVLAKATGQPGGRYVAPFEWTMGGDWTLTVTAALPDGRQAVRQFEISVRTP